MPTLVQGYEKVILLINEVLYLIRGVEILDKKYIVFVETRSGGQTRLEYNSLDDLEADIAILPDTTASLNNFS